MVVTISVDWIIGAVLLVFLLIPMAGIVVAIIDYMRWSKK